MATTRDGVRARKNPVTVSGPWFAMPLDFLQSRAWAELSPHAAKMLLDLCAGLGRNASGNGDLSAAPAVLQPKGWTSVATRVAALQELERVGLIVITRRGNRRKCNLYAVTLWPMDCDFTKLDHGPGAYSTSDWQRATPRGAEKPTKDAPAVWRPLRENENSSPAKRQPSPDEYPPRDKTATKGTPSVPAAGAMAPKLPATVVPLRDTFLDLPSGASTNPKGAVPESHETSSSGAANAPGQRRALAATSASQTPRKVD
jgi:hypothetical protein